MTMPDQDARTVVEEAMRLAADEAYTSSDGSGWPMDSRDFKDLYRGLKGQVALTRLLDLVEKGQALEWLEAQMGDGEWFVDTSKGHGDGPTVLKAINAARAASEET